MAAGGRTAEVDRLACGALAFLSLGAAGIHFAAAAQHVDESWYHPTFFGLIAWVQLGCGVALVTRPSRSLLAVTAAVNTAVLAVWVVSRTAGLPFGHDAGNAEPVEFVDGLASVFEALLVAGSLLLLTPNLATRRIPARQGAAGLAAVGAGVAGLSILSLTPALAGDGHGGHGEAVISADGTSACERSGFGNDGNSSHGHRGPVAFEPLSSADRPRFAAEVRQAQIPVNSFPTVQAALDGGYVLGSRYGPCVGSHYFNKGVFLSAFDPARPDILLFDGDEPDSELVGISYLERTDPETPPEGFTGSNDGWHAHVHFCVDEREFLDLNDDITEQECRALGGRLQPMSDVWMLHMWNVPGWENRWGLFSSEHPDLGGEPAVGSN